jgi:hypothetical protein
VVTTAEFAFADALLALEEEGLKEIADRLRARWPEVRTEEDEMTNDENEVTTNIERSTNG